MKKKNIGIVGWRGMVGQVLLERMLAEGDFKLGEFTFFSKGQAGADVVFMGKNFGKAQNSESLDLLKKMDIILTCQGGDYTKDIFPKLKSEGWNGHWIDAASALRMEKDAVIILDPVNMAVIRDSLQQGIKTYVGGNCTVSLMLMGLQGLFKAGLVEWVSTMTYQAASGAGAKNMQELVGQYAYVNDQLQKAETKKGIADSALMLEKKVNGLLADNDFPKQNFGHPLAYNLLPWIDSEYEQGQSREEWKGFAETNKILGTGKNPIPVDGTCVRVAALRCHSQGITVKLNKNVPLPDIEGMLKNANEWVKFVPNNREKTLADLTPASISGTLQVGVGRVRKMKMGEQYLNIFTLGDQLLWGAAEPLRRMLHILTE